MTINQADHIADNRRRQSLMAAGGLLGALAASSCCILPLALFGLGVSGAWIGNFTRLAPYQPCFIAATLAFLGYGYWLVYRSSTRACTDGEACPSIVKGSLEAVPGVAKVAVSFKDKTATVVYDDAKANVNQLNTATTEAGYPSAPKG